MEETLAKIKEIGRKMVEQDNQGTECPVWVVCYDGRLPRMFLTEEAAMNYIEEPGVAVQVASAFDNPQMLTIMAFCLRTAGVTDHPQAKNAYGTALLRNW